MRQALAAAAAAPGHDDVPIGAVLARGGEPLATAVNERELRRDPTAHAEILALRAAAATRADWHLEGCTLVVTLEPCVMCAGAVLAARVPTVVFGAWDEKAGAAGSVYDVLRDRRLNHQVAVYPGVLAEECADLLLDFFRAKR